MLYMYRLRTYRTKVMICSHRGEWRSQRASDNNNDTGYSEYNIRTVLVLAVLEYTSTRVLISLVYVLVYYNSRNNFWQPKNPVKFSKRLVCIVYGPPAGHEAPDQRVFSAVMVRTTPEI